MNSDELTQTKNSTDAPAEMIAVYIAPEKLAGGLCLAVGWMIDHQELYHIELKEGIYNLQQPAGPFVIHSQWGQDGACLSMDVKLR